MDVMPFIGGSPVVLFIKQLNCAYSMLLNLLNDSRCRTRRT
jgi:hypothetical protein